MTKSRSGFAGSEARKEPLANIPRRVARMQGRPAFAAPTAIPRDRLAAANAIMAVELSRPVPLVW
jgi:hypothetical protein